MTDSHSPTTADSLPSQTDSHSPTTDSNSPAVTDSNSPTTADSLPLQTDSRSPMAADSSRALVDSSSAATARFAVGLLSVSDRASRGDYEDLGIPALQSWLQKTIATPFVVFPKLVADDFAAIRAALTQLCDSQKCSLILTTGGTGPAARDVTPEATLAVADKTLPGFAEEMRRVSLRYVPTAILSRQVAAVRGCCLIINLPGQPKAIAETLQGIFSAVPYCLDLIGAPRIETDAKTIKAFRPKK